MSGLWQSFARSWQNHWVMQIATLTVLTASFTLITAFWNISQNMTRILADWGDKAQMTVYLKEDLADDELSVLKNEIQKTSEPQAIAYLSKSDAYKSFLQQVKNYAPDLADDQGFETSFPASFQLDFSEQINRQVDRFDWLVQQSKKISKLKGVEDISYGQGWVENYASFVQGLSLVGVTLMVILLSGGLFVVANSIRTSVMQRREEIEILELIGATASMIRKPYIFEGAMLGGLAGILSLFLSFALYCGQIKLIQTSWAFMGFANQLQFLVAWKCFIVVLGGCLVGGLGSYLTVLRINSGWSAAERLQ